MMTETVEIDLDKKRFLKLDMGALLAAEREINRQRSPAKHLSIFRLIDEEIGSAARDEETRMDVSADLILVLFWAALLHEDPKLTVEQTGRLANDLGKVIVATLLAVNRAFARPNVPESELEVAEKKTDAMNGTSGNSGRLPGPISD